MKRKTIIAVVLLIAWGYVGCTSGAKSAAIPVVCKNHIVIYDSFSVLLLSLTQDGEGVENIKEIKPSNQVVGQAMFNCENGVLIYNSEERMKAGVEGVLHFVYSNNGKETIIRDGINSFFPYGPNEILIRTAAIKKSKNDASLGDIKIDRVYMGPLGREKLNNANEGMQLFIENLIFDMPTLTVKKRVRGTIDPHNYQAGRFITYTPDGLIVELSPDTGHRKIVQSYLPSKDESGKAALNLIQNGSHYFYVNESLYLINGAAKNLEEKNVGYLKSNTIFKYSMRGLWDEVANLEFKPLLVFLNGSELVMVGQDYSAVYNIKTQVLEKFKIPIDGYVWTSVGSIDSFYVLAGVKGGSESKLFFINKDWTKKVLDYELNDISRPSISTMNTPVASSSLSE
jgi:hypothetical protein